MREAAVYEMGGQFHMEAVTVDQNDPTLTPQLRDYIRTGRAQPWTEWRVISTNKKGEARVYRVFNTEAECDAAMDELHIQAAASNELFRQDKA